VLHSVGNLVKRNCAPALLHLNVEVVVKQVEVAHLECACHRLLEQLDVVAVRYGDDKVIDIDPSHQLYVAIPSDVDGMFRRSPLKA
jgi:hypothetical protein